MTTNPTPAMSDAVHELISAVRSINRAKGHEVRIAGDDQPCYWQRKEWIDWLLELADAAEAQQRAKDKAQVRCEGCGELVADAGEHVDFGEEAQWVCPPKAAPPSALEYNDELSRRLWASNRSIVEDDTPSVPHSVDERAEFENLAKTFGYVYFERHKFDEPMSELDRSYDGRYLNFRLESAWQNFQCSRASLQTGKGNGCSHAEKVLQYTADGYEVEFCPECGNNTPTGRHTDTAMSGTIKGENKA